MVDVVSGSSPLPPASRSAAYRLGVRRTGSGKLWADLEYASQPGAYTRDPIRTELLNNSADFFGLVDDPIGPETSTARAVTESIDNSTKKLLFFNSERPDYLASDLKDDIIRSKLYKTAGRNVNIASNLAKSGRICRLVLGATLPVTLGGLVGIVGLLVDLAGGDLSKGGKTPSSAVNNLYYVTAAAVALISMDPQAFARVEREFINSMSAQQGGTTPASQELSLIHI